MASDSIGGAITFSTAIDNSDLEKGLADAQKKIEELKQKIEKAESEKSAIEQQMEGAQQALAEASAKADELRERMEYLQSIDISNEQWSIAQREIEGMTEKLREAEAEEDRLAQAAEELDKKYVDASNAVEQYKAQLASTEQTASSLSQRISSFYYQAGKSMKSSMDEVAASVSQLGVRIGNLMSSAMVFSVLRQGLNQLKNGIAEALMQNQQFSASWSYLSAAMQGFANGIANAIAPMLVSVINGVTACIMTLASAIDSVFKTSIASSIKQAQSAAEAAWRQTDASKAAQKQAEANAKAKAKQDEQYAKAQEQYAKQQQKAAERAAKAQEKLDERRAKEEGKYSEAVEDAAEKQAKAEQEMAERRAKAEEDAAARQAKAEAKAAKRQEKAEQSVQKRLAKAQESAAERQAAAEEANRERQESAAERYEKAAAKAAERQAKAEEVAALKNAEAQEAYEKKVAAAQAKEAAAKAAWDKKQAKAAEKLEKAQKKANETVMGFDELNKMNADASEDASDAVEEYQSTLQEIEPPKTYSVDPSDYFVDPSDYVAKLKEIDPSDYYVDPEDYAIDPEDYMIDPSDYAVDYGKYEVDPEDFFVDPDDYEFDPSEYVIDPEDYAIDPFSFDWQEFPEISSEEGLNPNWDAFDVGKIDEKMSAIMAILAGAKLAIGAILAFSGINIPLGLALMAVGALELATVVGENWEKLPAEMQNAITNALVISGIVLIVIGALLAFSGVATPLGVGLMAAGFLMEWTAVALNWASLTPEMQGAITALMGVLSGAFFALGVILLLAAPDPAHKAIGLGLMILGASGMVAAIALAWDSLGPQLQQAFTAVMVVVATFAIVIGVVLLLAVPGKQALGIGLIITGAALIAAAVALNWGALSETLVPALEAALKIVGTFAIVVGVVLLFVPGQLALGIGLIIFGIAMLGASEIMADWESLNGNLIEAFAGLVKTIAEVMLVIGVVLLFVPGHQALGIGLIIGGIALLAVGEIMLNWESLGEELAGTLGQIGERLAEVMLVIGVVLLFAPGQQAIAVGLIIGGIALFAVSEMALNWEELGEQLLTTLGTIGEQLVGIMLVIGVIMLFVPGARGWGIGMIVAGITIWAVSEFAIDWESTGGELGSALDALLQVIIPAMLVIGVVLLFVPGARAWGVGLIVGGIALIAVTAMDLDFETLPGEIEGAITTITTVVSAALLVLGIILIFTGVAAPLGAGLIAAGAVGLAAELALNWDFLLEKVQEVWESVVDWWEGGPAQIFTAEWWVNLFSCIPEAIADAVNGAIEIVNDFIEGISQALGDIVGATGGSFEGPSYVSNVRPPGLARGAVIPPNRQFMAVLGDQTSGNNIETPEALMRDVVREEAGRVMAEMMLSMGQASATPATGGGDAYMVLNIDGQELTRTIVESGADMARRGMLNSSVSFA